MSTHSTHSHNQRRVAPEPLLLTEQREALSGRQRKYSCCPEQVQRGGRGESGAHIRRAGPSHPRVEETGDGEETTSENSEGGREQETGE